MRGEGVDWLGRWSLSATLSLARLRWLRPLLREAREPGRAQRMLLRKILAENAATEFGREHGFPDIVTPDEWRDAVPVHSYEALCPWIDRQIETGAAVLTREMPVMYAMTSGTTANPKLIPVTRSVLRNLKRSQYLFVSALHGFDPEIFRGRVFGLSSPAVEGRLTNGVPYGSASGVIYRQTPTLVRSRSLLPEEVFEIDDYDAKYREIATYMLADETVTLATVANPSTLLRLLGVIEENLDEILIAVSGGHPCVRARPERVRALSRIADTKGRLDLGDIWPNLRGIATWTGGSCGVSLDSLRSRTAVSTRIFEFGYAASEFRGTINVDPGRNLCLPALNDVYFEFVEQSAWEEGRRDFKRLEQLESGRRYTVIATTPGGLYRYHINDIVEVVGYIGATPALGFVQKGQGVTNITGEKLSEAQMAEAIRRTEGHTGVRLVFYLALADEARSGYDVYVELDEGGADPGLFASLLEQSLCDANVEYRAKLASGRLAPLRVHRLRRGAEDAYLRHAIASGQREGQYKMLPLVNAGKVSFDFAPWLER